MCMFLVFLVRLLSLYHSEVLILLTLIITYMWILKQSHVWQMKNMWVYHYHIFQSAHGYDITMNNRLGALIREDLSPFPLGLLDTNLSVPWGVREGGGGGAHPDMELFMLGGLEHAPSEMFLLITECDFRASRFQFSDMLENQEWPCMQAGIS